MLAALSQSGMVNATRSKARTQRFGGQTFNVVEIPQTEKNVNVVLAPRGTGYISARMPDGTAAGGNQRGNHSVDLQISGDDNPIKVPSGAGSLASGIGNTVSGAYSGCIGYRNTASTLYTFAGGNGSVASGFGAFCWGFSATASAQKSAAFGASIASGTASFAVGEASTAAGSYSMASGIQSSAPLYGQLAHASAFFAAAGDAQVSTLVARRATAADATPVNLFLDGASARLVIPANTTWQFTVSIVARTTTAGAAYASFVRSGVLWRGVAVGTTAIVTTGGISTDQGSNAGAPPAGWAVAITADTVNGALDIQCTGSAAAGAARWVACIELTEVTYA